MSFRSVPISVTLYGVMALILRYFTESRSLSGAMRKSVRLWCRRKQVLSSSWDMRPFGHSRHWPKIGGCAPLGEGLGPHLTQCGQAEAYFRSKWHLYPTSRLVLVRRLPDQLILEMCRLSYHGKRCLALAQECRLFCYFELNNRWHEVSKAHDITMMMRRHRGRQFVLRWPLTLLWWAV